MRIGIIIVRIGGVDGVALETEKWIHVLEQMGHEIFILTGEIEEDFGEFDVEPLLALGHPNTVRDQNRAFLDQAGEEDELILDIEVDAQLIYKSLQGFVHRHQIDVILTENCTTLPCHLSLGLALTRFLKDTGIPAIAHDHDFRWERGDRYISRYSAISEIMDKSYPPNLPNLQHICINTNAKKDLAARGIQAVVAPNVMDFKLEFGKRDEYNSTLCKDLNIGEEDIILFQMTRIVRRKGIETALELVHRLGDSRIKLFVTGSPKDDERAEYYHELLAMINDLNLSKQVFFVSDRVQNLRGRTPEGDKIYSLSDAYAYAAGMTYFSTYEGFGNAFVEAVLAKVPIFVNNYEPVYWPDIGSLGFETVQIENSTLSEEAIKSIRSIIEDPQRQEEIGEKNFTIGKKHFSYEVLADILKAQIDSLQV